MTDRLFAEDIAARKKITVRHARRILAAIERTKGPRIVGRVGRRRFIRDPREEVALNTTTAPTPESERVQALEDEVNLMRRQIAELERRMADVERRV